MSVSYAALSHVPLAPAAGYVRPPTPPRLVHLDDSALDVLTDFRHVWPVTTTPDVALDAALDAMKRAGVRLLLVVDGNDEIAGVITANDIQGERPVQIARAARIPREGITVGQVMTPRDQMEVLNLVSVRNARVGNIVATLRALERQHALVAEIDPESGAQILRGVFSTSQLSRQLGVPVIEDVRTAHSFAEVVQEIGMS